MDSAVKIPRLIIDRIIDHARSVQPQECCGLLAGIETQVFSYHPLQNKSSEPETRYFAAPEDLFEAMKKMRAAGESLIAIYHSHPSGPCYPSQTDIELAFYPQAYYLVVALEPQTELRAFRIIGQEVIEVLITEPEHQPLVNEINPQ